jgi:uncharacterized protein YcsI (UPF0317 family)
MKANKAPEKLYLLPNGLISYCRTSDGDIEYTRTDAFINKACEWLECNLSDRTKEDIKFWIEDFVTFMKGG